MPISANFTQNLSLKHSGFLEFLLDERQAIEGLLGENGLPAFCLVESIAKCGSVEKNVLSFVKL